MKISKEFIQQSIHFIALNPSRIQKCLNQLTEEQVWIKPNSQTNSIGNLVLHLCGNITQYIHHSMGGEKDSRKRDLEFSTTGGFSKKELIEKLEFVVQKATQIIQNCSEDELMRTRLVQGFSYTGIGIIIHVTEHFSYHTGQIALWTKYLVEKDLGFYADYDLNIRN